MFNDKVYTFFYKTWDKNVTFVTFPPALDIEEWIFFIAKSDGFFVAMWFINLKNSSLNGPLRYLTSKTKLNSLLVKNILNMEPAECAMNTKRGWTILTLSETFHTIYFVKVHSLIFRLSKRTNFWTGRFNLKGKPKQKRLYKIVRPSCHPLLSRHLCSW